MKNVLVFTLLLVASGDAGGQQQPTVEQILPRVVAYAREYRERVPAFEADESAVTQQLKGGKVKWEVRLEATLRVLRDDSKPVPFTDKYTFRLVDGQSPKSHFKLPWFAQGVFSNAVGFVRMGDEGCYDYRLGPGDVDGSVQLEMWVKPGNPLPACKDVFEDYRKTLVVDAASGRILHVTRSMSARAAKEHHEIFFLSLDYGPQKLGEETFWLPVRFEAHNDQNEKRMTATFSNFHRYSSTLKVIASDPLPDSSQ